MDIDVLVEQARAALEKIPTGAPDEIRDIANARVQAILDIAKNAKKKQEPAELTFLKAAIALDIPGKNIVELYLSEHNWIRGVIIMLVKKGGIEWMDILLTDEGEEYLKKQAVSMLKYLRFQVQSE